MADVKISGLPAATTPLAGTEILPIVQSGSTVKVANNDLRPKQIQSNATSGVLQVTGPAAATTRVMTVPDANFTAARTDAANSFTGNQTLSTGNLVQGTAAKGFNFTANSYASGMTSQLLNYYEEGTFTPTMAYGGTPATSYYAQAGLYTRVGNVVNFWVRISANDKGAGTGAITVLGLPFTSNATLTTVVSGLNDQANTIAYSYISASSTTITTGWTDATYNVGYALVFSGSYRV